MRKGLTPTGVIIIGYNRQDKIRKIVRPRYKGLKPNFSIKKRNSRESKIFKFKSCAISTSSLFGTRTPLTKNNLPFAQQTAYRQKSLQINYHDPNLNNESTQLLISFRGDSTSGPIASQIVIPHRKGCAWNSHRGE